MLIDPNMDSNEMIRLNMDVYNNNCNNNDSNNDNNTSNNNDNNHNNN